MLHRIAVSLMSPDPPRRIASIPFSDSTAARVVRPLVVGERAVPIGSATPNQKAGVNFGNSAFESRPSASVSEAFQTSDAGGPFTSLPGSFTGEPSSFT